MLVSQIQHIVPDFGLDWDPLARAIYVHYIHPEQQPERIRVSCTDTSVDHISQKFLLFRYLA